jgi:hypothetical protein
VYDPTDSTQLNLGCVKLNANYVGNNRTFGASGTASSMSIAGGDVTIVLGTASGTTRTVGGNATMTWTTSASAYDRAANNVTAADVTEAGPADPNF